MRILCVDMGNTHTHCAVVEDMRVLVSWDVPTREFAESFTPERVRALNVEGLSWCSVVPSQASLFHARLVSDFKGIDAYRLSFDNSPIPIDSKNPPQVGQDRIAVAVGAGAIFKPPYIIVDMGTAVTIDLVDSNGVYAGGAIAPGLYAFTDYLNERAALLPRIDPAGADYSLSLGKNTLEAMQVGCVKGFCRLVDGIISDMEKDYFHGDIARSKTVFTGGSVSLLPKKWLAERKVECNLANIGLFMAFKFNKGNKL